MTKPENPQRSPEQEARWTESKKKGFRQAKALAEIFYSLSKNQNKRLDPETNRILFDTISMPEGMPAINSTKEEKEAWANRTVEIENETEIWIGLLEDGSVEIVYERTRFDKGYITPSVSLNDIGDALSNMTCSIRQDQEEAKVDPFAAHIRKISQPGRMVLKRSRERLVLHPNNTVSQGEWSEEYNEDGHVTVSRDKAEATFKSTDDEVSVDISTLHFNLFNVLRSMLNSAVQYGESDPNSVHLTKEIRKQILTFALTEIQHIDHKKRQQKALDFSGQTIYNQRLVSPAVEQSLYETRVSDSGQIEVRHIAISVPFEESFISQDLTAPEPVDMNDGLENVMSMQTKVLKSVRTWSKEKKSQLGDEAYNDFLQSQLDAVHTALIHNQGNVSGQSRILIVQPETQRYQYSFVRKVPTGNIDNRTPEAIFIQRQGNPEDPSFDELATLLSLTL